RLPLVHSEHVAAVLEKQAAHEHKLANIADHYFPTRMWEETAAQANGTITRNIKQPTHAGEWIASGPHIYVLNPFFQTPNGGCRNPRDYADIDLDGVADAFLPRTLFIPQVDAAEYRRRTPHWGDTPITKFYRVVARNMIDPTGERTLIPSIIPPAVGHID